ncbi:hypothetical protein NHJ13734_008952 [Beauveria thailandica]
MTTNYIDRIDPALIRPGRVDKRIEFELANREMLLGLFRYIYLPLPNKTERAEANVEEVVENQDAQIIQQRAVTFADRVPEMKYSAAKILSFLTAHKRSSQDAVDNVISWVEGGGEGFVPLLHQTSSMSATNEGSAAKEVVVLAGQSWTIVLD